jgi:glycosyltransferase involved in cell wall biosynthesis
MPAPKISIVIPSFNQGKFIERTLLSILKQDYQGEVEVIVSDGGSTDNTVDILKKYDKQILWWSEKDSGYADAVNKGFKKATGEIYAIQSSDDYYLRDAFLHIVESFDQHADASLICGREALQNPGGDIIEGYLLPGTITPRGFLLDHTFPGIFQHTTFFKQEYYEKSKGMRSQFDMCADADLFYRLLHFANGYFLNRFIAVYQRHDLQRTQKQTLKFKQQLLDMVLNCREDPFYSKHYAVSDEDYSLFNSFVNLFYLQYENLQLAKIKASEAVSDVKLDNRTKALAQQLLDSPEIKRNEPSVSHIKKFARIMTRLYKKYILNDITTLNIEDNVTISDVIEPDWWQNRSHIGV